MKGNYGGKCGNLTGETSEINENLVFKAEERKTSLLDLPPEYFYNEGMETESDPANLVEKLIYLVLVGKRKKIQTQLRPIHQMISFPLSSKQCKHLTYNI